MCFLTLIAFLFSWTALGAQSIQVASAASLRPVLEALAPKFAARYPTVQLRVNYGSSGSLATQIIQGAPFDVFLAADAVAPAKIQSANLSFEGSFSFATGRLVLWVNKDLGLDPSKEGLKILLNPSAKRIALAQSELAPFGKAAEAVLQNAGLFQTLQPRLIFGENVGQVAQYLQSGVAQAGFISSGQLVLPGLSSGKSVVLPASSYPPLPQQGVILLRSSHRKEAQAFKKFLLSKEAQDVLAKLGYGAP